MNFKHLTIIAMVFLASCENKKTVKYPNGEIMAEIEVNNKGHNHGKKIGYFENGKIQLEAVYQNDTLNGPYTDYYENGNKRVECTYNNGNINGIHKSYYYTGQIKSVTNYKNDLYDGNVLFYYTNGLVKTKAVFKNNQYLYYLKYDSIGNVIDKDYFIQIDILNKLSKNDSLKIKAKIHYFVNTESRPIFTYLYKYPLTTEILGQNMLFNRIDSSYYFTFMPVKDTGKYAIGVSFSLENKFSIRTDSIITIK